MRDLKSTPGPWKVNPLYSKVETDSLIICTNDVNAGNEEFDYETWKANAKLIAAAPDLLKACINALACIDHIGDILNEMDVVEPETEEFTTPLIESIREAIKRATE